jgi:hypothetical protein
MHLFASRRSERHAQARRITAGPIPAYLSTRYASSCVFGSSANILPRKGRQAETRTYISGAPPNTALLRLSGQHGAARGAIR